MKQPRYLKRTEKISQECEGNHTTFNGFAKAGNSHHVIMVNEFSKPNDATERINDNINKSNNELLGTLKETIDEKETKLTDEIHVASEINLKALKEIINKLQETVNANSDKLESDINQLLIKYNGLSKESYI
jgi:hypothetical protein